MHKSLQEIQNKDWSKMQSYLLRNKNQYEPASKAMEAHKELDFEKMFLEDSDLFIFFVSIHVENNGKYDVEKFWNLRYQAYQQLKNDGLFNLDLTQQKIQLVKDFEDKLAGPCLISKKDLEDSMTVKKKRNEVSVHFDYHEVLDLIESHYEINVRRIFDSLKHEKIQEICAKYFFIDDDNKFSRTSPVDSLEANYLNVISDTIREQVEHIDFWHHITDYDFSDISNGSIASMWKPDDKSDVILEEIINTKKEFQIYISQLIKKSFFKELSQLKEVGSCDGIEFLIEW